MMEIKTAIVSGATGAIGTALVDLLVSNNVEVKILSRKNSDRIDQLAKMKKVSIDFCDLSEYKKLKNSSYKCYDAFFHLAWAGTTGPERNDKNLQMRNVEYAVDAVKLAAEFGCKVFVGVGSQAEYGIANEMLRADTKTNPITEYGKSKLIAGEKTRILANELGMRHVWARVLSVYGPNDTRKSMVMSTIMKLMANEPTEFTPGEQIWDYLYSADAAEALFLMAERGKDGKIYVLGGGNKTPLKDYIKTIRDIVSPETELGMGKIPYGKDALMYLSADISELKKDLEWKPSTSFECGIKKILEDI